MKLTITTLKGDKFDVEVKAEDKVKDIKAQLYRAGRVTSAMRLLHAQAQMEDDRRLCEYSLPEGAVISALFQPDVEVNIDVTCGHETQKLTISNATSVMALKVQICGGMRCGVAPEKLEIRLGDVTLEDPMPLHFYRIKNGSKLDVVKPYVGVMVENNKGDKTYWRLNRKDAIRDVKARMATSSNKTDPEGRVKVEQLRLYLITDDQSFEELDEDDETVEDYKIQDGDKLFLLTYSWAGTMKVTVKKTGRELETWGLEKDDTCLVVKVKIQDQFGIPVRSIKLARSFENQWPGYPAGVHAFGAYGYIPKKQLTEIGDEENPLKYKEPLYVATEEELQADAARVNEEQKAWQEQYLRAVAVPGLPRGPPFFI